jgi:type I restriction enzyme S subunit
MTNMTTLPLGELMTHRSEFVPIDDLTTYMRCRVQINGRGVVLRDRVEGALLKTKIQQVCRAGEFLVAEIDAKLGGFGVVPSELAGAIVSSHYFLFDINPDLLDGRYLAWFSKTAGLAEQVSAHGSTNYSAVRPHHVLTYEIPVPPTLSDQQRIIAAIESIAARLAVVRHLRQGVLDDGKALLRSVFHRLIQGAPYRPLAAVAPIVRRPVEIDPDSTYEEIGIRSFHKGTFFKCNSPGSDISRKSMFEMVPGDLVFSNIMAWEGGIAVVRPEDRGRIGVHRFITCVPHPDIADPHFLWFYFQTGEGFAKIVSASPATIARNRTLSVKKLETIEVPVPSLEKQQDFAALQQRIAAIHQAQAANQSELDALLPAVLDKAFKGEL